MSLGQLMTTCVDQNAVWLAIGLLGQGLFFGRFFVQWLASERKGASVVPVAFWYFSMGGGVILLLYAIHRHDLVIIVGQLGGLFIYARNIYFIHRKPRALAQAAS
jgi:lipid-A-disaccharide synthase-like uncharacterized protein